MEEIDAMIINCPACKKDASSIMKELEIPHFGKVMETSILCKHCGFKHSDIIALEHNEPSKYVLKINKNKLSTRVVRSQSATVSIPEFGLKVEPGPKSEGYVTNVEGILVRFKEAVKRAMNLFCNKNSEENGNICLNNIEKLLNGEIEATLIIEDPFGQSNISDEDVEISKISENDLKNLKTGFNIIEDK